MEDLSYAMEDFFWGFINGLTAWVVVVAHLFGFLEDHPVYDDERSGDLYDIAFLLGAGSPLFGLLGI